MLLERFVELVKQKEATEAKMKEECAELEQKLQELVLELQKEQKLCQDVSFNLN